MKYRTLLAALAFAALELPGQQQAMVPAAVPEVKPDTVIAVLNGRKYTADEIKKLIAIVPPQVQAAFKADPKQFLRDHAWYLYLQDLGEKNNIDQQSPTRESLEFARLIVLSQAAFNWQSRQVEVTPEEQKKHYEANKDSYRECAVSMIYIPFTDPENEGESKAKAEAIVKRAKGGEDFAKLMQETGQSADSRFNVRKDSAQPPEHMRRVILPLSKGEVTPALRHDNGYYVFRIESADVLPFESVRNEIYRAIQDSKFEAWQKDSRAKVPVQFLNEEFFSTIGKEK